LGIYSNPSSLFNGLECAAESGLQIAVSHRPIPIIEDRALGILRSVGAVTIELATPAMSTKSFPPKRAESGPFELADIISNGAAITTADWR
jgi:spore maturation protein SpmB